jgi:murein DD-endopeptidase MepM/ murein hydrolase activator NlpD
MSGIRLLTFSFLIVSIPIFSGCIRGLKPIRVIAELKTGETQNVKLSSGKVVRLKLIDIKEVRDSLRNAIREALVTVSVNGNETVLKTGNYNLPVSAGDVQLDCTWIKGFEAEGSSSGHTGDAMIRIWPEQTPFLNPLTFTYPVNRQKWFATMTQSGHEPVYVDWGEDPGQKSIYYHQGHDIGGTEGMDEIISATDGIVVSAGNKLLEGYDSFPVYVHPDAVSVLDDRGWILEYVHLDTVFADIKLGSRINMGQKIGLMGKKGTSGGWVHLHFEIKTKDTPSGNWVTEDAYAYLWEAYMKQHSPKLVAVARPHQFIWSGDEAVFDGSRSRSSGKIVEYEWTFHDGTTAYGPVQRKKFTEPGEYSEILKVTDSRGNTDFDFAVVQVSDRLNPEKYFPTIQPAFYESTGIEPGEPVLFFVRTFNASVGEEVWNFGDGSPEKKVVSPTVNRKNSTAGRFAETTHSFPRPGSYIVTVERTNENGYKATGRLHVVVDE